MNGPYRPKVFDPENPMVYQPYVSYTAYTRINPGTEAHWKDESQYAPKQIKEFDKLPSKIQAIVTRVLEDSLRQWTGNVVFHSARVYSPERFYKDEVLSQANYGLILRYQLWFIFSFPEKRIEEYCFEMSLDQYGQVLKFEFPRFFHFLEQTLYHYDRAAERALGYIKTKNYKPDFFDLELTYDADSGKLNWKFCYLQKEIDAPAFNQKKIRVIIVDLVLDMVIYDQELHAFANKIPTHKEERTVLSETIWNGERVQVTDVAITMEEPPDPEEEWPEPPEQ